MSDYTRFRSVVIPQLLTYFNTGEKICKGKQLNDCETFKLRLYLNKKIEYYQLLSFFGLNKNTNVVMISPLFSIVFSIQIRRHFLFHLKNQSTVRDRINLSLNRHRTGTEPAQNRDGTGTAPAQNQHRTRTGTEPEQNSHSRN